MSRSWLLILALFSWIGAYSTHIVGGEMYYDFLGKSASGEDIYRITLKIYRDCLTGQANFDGLPNGSSGQTTPAVLTVREVMGSFVAVYDIGAPVVTPVPKTINSQCIQTPNDACLEEGTYTYTIQIPPKTGGYYVIYQRCCRNNTIANILQPGDQGSTYFTKIPGPEEATSNNSARFTKFPPIFLCGSITFGFDHSAFDPDGDKLVYSFYTPFLGSDKCCVNIGNTPPGPTQTCPNPPVTCPQEAPPPPYPVVTYVAPFTAANPVDASPPLSIDPNTGQINGKPKTVAQYVVGVKVEEYRNGKLINTLYRDFQFNIRSCVVAVTSEFAEPLKKCRGTTLTFSNQSKVSTGTPWFHWDFGVPSVSNDTSNVKDPTFAFQDTGKYVVMLVTNPGSPCSDTMRRLTYVYPLLDIQLPKQPPQCMNGNRFALSPGGGFIPETQFKWTFDTSATPQTSTLKYPEVKYKYAGVHNIKLLAYHYSCADSTSDTVRVYRRPVAIINNLPQQLCDPGTIYFSNGSVADLPLRHYWTFYGQNTRYSSEVNPVFTFSNPGRYSASLKVVTEGACKDSSSTMMSDIIINPLPAPAFTFTPRETSIFEPEILVQSTITDGIQSMRFDFGDGGFVSTTPAKHVYAQPGTYSITQTVTNYFGCTKAATDSVRILPEFRFWIPNAFTPDDNNRNELFGPVCIGTSNFVFEVYDRWGHRLYQTRVPNEGWNGKVGGQPCKQDIYTWRAGFKNAVTGKYEERVGHFLLLLNP